MHHVLALRWKLRVWSSRIGGVRGWLRASLSYGGTEEEFREAIRLREIVWVEGREGDDIIIVIISWLGEGSFILRSVGVCHVVLRRVDEV